MRVFEPPATQTVAIEPAGGSITARFRLVAIVEAITERFVRIIEAGTERLVTVIEFVSPTNKRAPGLAAFRMKRAELLANGVNFVEVDLVRSGSWRALLRPHACAPVAISVYRVCFRIPQDPGVVHLEPITIQQRLPRVNIPLRRSDPMVSVDLQTLVDDAYRRGRYEQRIDYSHGLDPPLDSEEAAWADALLKSAGKRP